MNWRNVLKESKLDSVQDTVMSVKPEQRDNNCLRTLKTLIRELKRFVRKYDGYASKKYNIENEYKFYIGNKASEETACYLIREYSEDRRTSEEIDGYTIFTNHYGENSSEDNSIYYNASLDVTEYSGGFGAVNLDLAALGYFSDVTEDEEIVIRVLLTFTTEEKMTEAAREISGILKRVLG